MARTSVLRVVEDVPFYRREVELWSSGSRGQAHSLHYGIALPERGHPEIAAYFVGALAGGVISVALIRKDLVGDRKWVILQDAVVLTIIAVVILIIAALMEVYFTPLFF